MIQPDPELSALSASLERSLDLVARELTPADFSGMIGAPGLSILRSAMDSVGADSLSVWLADPEETKVVVTHSEPDPAFIGWEQSINEGLIALVYASEQCLCENQVYQNAHHSKRADEALGQVTCSMIGTPFYIAGNLRGVISCVQLKDTPDAPDPSGFTARNMNRIRRLSTVIERLVNYRMLTSLLNLEL